MRNPIPIVVVAGLFGLAACTSKQLNSFSEVPCTCGSAEAAFEGCACGDCMDGEGNVDNPECCCAAMSFE